MACLERQTEPGKILQGKEGTACEEYTAPSSLKGLSRCPSTRMS